MNILASDIASASDINNLLEMTQQIEALDDSKLDGLSKIMCWGTFGRNADKPLEKRRFCDLDSAHIENIICTQDQLHPVQRKVFLYLLRSRQVAPVEPVQTWIIRAYHGELPKSATNTLNDIARPRGCEYSWEYTGTLDAFHKAWAPRLWSVMYGDIYVTQHNSFSAR